MTPLRQRMIAAGGSLALLQARCCRIDERNQAPDQAVAVTSHSSKKRFLKHR